MLARTEQTSNQILAQLSVADFALVQPYLARIELPVRKQMESRGAPIKHVYFLESGLASIVATISTHSIEAGVIGREGVVGIPVILEAGRSTHETYMQIGGIGWRIAAEDLRRSIDASATLRRALLHFAHVMMTQMSFTSLAGACYNTDERLARWLLMAQDRIDGPAIGLTHEFLSLMLGTRRAGVTVALQLLESKDIISMRRGEIFLRNRQALEEAANGAYGAPEMEYKRLFQDNRDTELN